MIWMMRGEAPNDGAAPIVAHPHRLLGTQGVQEFEHVLDDHLKPVVLMIPVDTRAPVAAHVRRNGAEPQARKARELVAPAERKFRPTVHKYHQGGAGGSAGEV